MNLRELAEALFLPVAGLVFAFVAFPTPGEQRAAEYARPAAPAPAAPVKPLPPVTLPQTRAPTLDLGRSAIPLAASTTPSQPPARPTLDISAFSYNPVPPR